MAGAVCQTEVMATFADKLLDAIDRSDSPLCVGLDPDPDRLPAGFPATAAGVLAFNRAIIDATAPFAAAFKPQIAYYAAFGWEETLAETLRHLRRAHPEKLTILDAKRGDIASTARMYAIEAFDRYGADAVTVNPYLGSDAVAPFLERPDRGAVILARTSNASSADFQELPVADADGGTVCERVARLAATRWNAHRNVMLVVGATHPEAAARLRRIVGDACAFLVPGVGAQGGRLEEILPAAKDSTNRGLLVNASRSILFASRGGDFAAAAAAAARGLAAAMREILRG